MSGRHPWNKLFEATFSPEQRAQIIRDADKLVADIDRREALTAEASPRTRSLQAQGPEAASSASPAPVRSGQSS